MNNKLNNKSYKVVITETSSRVVTITADEVQKILNIKSNNYVPKDCDICSAVRHQYNDEKYVLDASDFDDVDFKVLDTNK